MTKTEKIAKLEELLVHKKSKSYYAKKLGVNILELNKLLIDLKGRTKVFDLKEKVTQVLDNSFEEDFKKGTGELTAYTKKIETLEDLIRECKIDTNIWRIDKYVQNYWGNDMYQVKAWLGKKNIDTDLGKQKDAILKLLTAEGGNIEYKTTKQKLPKWFTNPKGEPVLLEISLPDLHLGKLAWDKEAGEDYDLDIAVARYKEAVAKLLSRVDLTNVERIHLPLGNDAIHIDNSENTTTAGTAVDTDGRFPKILRAAKKLFIETITELQLIAPVDVTIVRGNHDSQTMFLLGEILSAWFHHNQNVMINNDPKFRKYYQYGECGFLYTHGDKEKHSELGMVFATEHPELWAATKFRFCKLGHFHKSKKIEYVAMDTFNGFQIEILPSLSGTDEWHYSKAYLANKQGKAFLYSRTEGEIAAYIYTV